MDVIVLDGNCRSALAVTRSLGMRGVNVTVGAETKASLSSSSKYCSNSFLYPSQDSGNLFIDCIRKNADPNTTTILLPVTDVSLSEVLQNKDQLGPRFLVPFPDYDTYRSASDKAKLFRLASRCDVPIPATLFSSDFSDTESLIAGVLTLGFPVVVKPSLSKMQTERGWIGACVCYARDEAELRTVLSGEVFRSFPFVIQERIEGAGVGIFLLMHDGKVVARFAHRRIREKPPSGGVSVLSESVIPHPVALEGAVKLLQSLNWQGIAMVEMKEDSRDGIPKLIEINARFWGSLQLAVSSGVDFPYHLYCLASGTPFEPDPKYSVGVRLRWELGDLDHLLLRFRKSPKELALPSGSPSKIQVLRQFALDFLNPNIKNEVLRPGDPGPFVFEIKQYVKEVIR